MAPAWSKGRGKLGFLGPLLGEWLAEGGGEQGPYRVTRRFERTLQGTYVRLDADWQLADRSYQELALFGRDREGSVCFWSFTSDGRQSQGRLAEASELPGGGFAFEADMPAGRGRMAYWPPEAGEGFCFAVEARTRAGWKRFLEHRYEPLPPGG